MEPFPSFVNRLCWNRACVAVGSALYSDSRITSGMTVGLLICCGGLVITTVTPRKSPGKMRTHRGQPDLSHPIEINRIQGIVQVPRRAAFHQEPAPRWQSEIGWLKIILAARSFGGIASSSAITPVWTGRLRWMIGKQIGWSGRCVAR